jgi:hypothetical protein
MRSRFLAVCFAVLVSLVYLASCAKGPAPVKPGSPAFFWGAARAAYASADYIKTNDNLGQLTATDNEYTGRARIWELVVSGGLALGYTDLAQAYEDGRKFTRKDAAPFREQVRLHRAAAKQSALLFGETFRRSLDLDKADRIPLAFDFPPPAEAAPPQLAKLGKGLLIMGAEADTLQAAMLRDGVRTVASYAAGSPTDSAKAADVYKAGAVARADFLTGMAAVLFDQSALFGPKKLDEPQRLTAFCILAQTALGQVPETRQTRELQGKIRKALGPRRSS